MCPHRQLPLTLFKRMWPHRYVNTHSHMRHLARLRAESARHASQYAACRRRDACGGSGL
jgi:hypothetical protein